MAELCPRALVAVLVAVSRAALQQAATAAAADLLSEEQLVPTAGARTRSLKPILPRLGLDPCSQPSGQEVS